jgi:hypothetical protein
VADFAGGFLAVGREEAVKMIQISWIAIHLILFTTFLSVAVILYDWWKFGKKTHFVWVRVLTLAFTFFWYSALAVEIVPVPLSWPSIVSRFLVVALVAIVFYDRFHIP